MKTNSVARFSVFAPDLAFFTCLSRFFKKSGAMARNDQNLVVFGAFKFYLFFLRFWRKIWCFLPYFPGFSQFFSRQDKNWDYLNYHGNWKHTFGKWLAKRFYCSLFLTPMTSCWIFFCKKILFFREILASMWHKNAIKCSFVWRFWAQNLALFGQNFRKSGAKI